MKYKNNGEWKSIKVKNYGIEQTPIGSMIYYPSQTIPSGYLVCDGSEVLIADYPLLFNAIGYIGGDDVLTGYFRLPDMRGIVPAGYNPDIVGSSNPLAGNFGDQVGAPSHQLTENEIPPSFWHANSLTYDTIDTYFTPGNTYGLRTNPDRKYGNNFSIVQPTKLYNWIIKAKNVVTLGGYTEDFEVQGDLNVIGSITQNNNNIIEQGTNYIKYYDGTLITKQVKSISTTINGTWGNLYISADISLDNYPIKFIETPIVSIYVDSSNSAFVMNAGIGNTTRPSPINLCRGQSLSTSNTYNIYVTAIGRWK